MTKSARWPSLAARLTMPTLLVALTACASAPAATLPTPNASTSAPAGLERFYAQQPRWSNCGNADCARLEVPVDYADPAGPTIELNMARVPAAGKRIGTLFVDPGGPGGSAVDYAKYADGIVSPDVRAAYDIVGVDPRGVGTSAPVRCLTDAETDELLGVDGTPDTAAEEQAVVDTSAMLGAKCALNAGDLLAHMGTADAARDLDIARAVVGDDAFNYLGKSYGTLLGATYADLFPGAVGRMVLDGVLTSDGTFETISHQQGLEFAKVLRIFLEDCLLSDGCPFTGTVDEAQQQLAAWLDSLDAAPLPALEGAGEPRELTGALASYAVLANLYFPSTDFPALRSALLAAMQHDDPAELFALLDARISRGPDGRYLDNSTDAFYAVTCLDTPYDGTVDDVRALARTWGQEMPVFGASLAWGLLACKDWPARAEQPALLTAKGSNPILLVSPTTDPATPHAWAQEMADQLDNATLLTWDAVNHTAYGEGSECIDEAVDAYLLEGTLPPGDLVCQ